jgi:HK97 family phage major capsid protein
MSWKQRLEQMRGQIRQHSGVVEQLRGKFDDGTISDSERQQFEAALSAAETIRSSEEFKNLVDRERQSVRASGLINFVAGSGGVRSGGGTGGGTPPGDDDDLDEQRSADEGGSYGRQVPRGQPGGAVRNGSERRSNFSGGTPDRPSDAPSLRTSRNFARLGVDPHEYHEAQEEWMRKGERLEERHRRVLAPGACNERGELRNTQNVTFGTDGAFLLSPIMANRVLEAERAFYGVENLGAEVMTVGGGSEFLFPSVDDTTRRAQPVGEGADDSANRARLAFALDKFDIFKYGTPSIVITRECLEDPQYDVAGIVQRALSNSLKNAATEDFVVGDGIGRPLGLMPALQAGKVTANTNQPNYFRVLTATSGAVTPQDFLNLIAGVGDLYKMAPNSRYGMSSGTLLSAVMAFNGSDGHPIFRNKQTEGPPTVIHGREYRLASYMASLTGTTSQTSGRAFATYGDHSAYKVGLSSSIALRRFDQVPEAANVDGIAFKGFQRMGGKLVHEGITAESRKLAFLAIQ